MYHLRSCSLSRHLRLTSPTCRLPSSSTIRFTSTASNPNIFEVVENNELTDIPISQIRNFSVIAHVDHGKSTLSDSILQYLGNINDKQRKKGQVLDTLQVERERGITVKAQTASMIFNDKRTNKRYLLNLIDTPGHIDFNYEVSRSLSSCQGALLLVDASQSIQAQTISNYHKAIKLDLDIIPVITKTDLPNAQPEETALALETSFKFDPDHVIMTSAKRNSGIIEVIEAIVDRLPFPKPTTVTRESVPNEPFRGRIVDSWFDEHRGVVCLVQVCNGTLTEGQRITTIESAKDHDFKSDYSVQEVGLLTPEPLRTGSLRTGQVGYVISGMRSTRQARIGDTIYNPIEITDLINRVDKTLLNQCLDATILTKVNPFVKLAKQLNGADIATPAAAAVAVSTTTAAAAGGNTNAIITTINPLPGYEDVKSMLYASIFPVDSNDFEDLFAAVERLCLNDSSISVTKEYSTALGSGLRCGFLGFLHMEVFNQRLSDEYNMNTVMTTPSVPYVIRYLSDLSPDYQQSENEIITALLPTDIMISNISEWPDINKPAHLVLATSPTAGKSGYFKILEPIVKINIISPNEFYGVLLEAVKQRRGMEIEVTYLEDGKTFQLHSYVPWQEIVSDMHDVIKNSSSGYASFDYEDVGYKISNLVKVEMHVNGDICDPLSIVCHQDQAFDHGRRLATKLKEVIQRQQFEIIIQAKINAKVLARERIAPYRKDVLARSGKLVGGGDISRKKKLLEKQKEGKKRQKMFGKVEIGQEAFWAVLQR